MVRKLRKFRVLLIAFAFALLFLFRALLFTQSYGSIEHDSGWYLGVAANVARHGLYASSSNTITSPGSGAFYSIHHRISVQDQTGYIYFPAGVTVGPGYVLPEAFIIRFFGEGFWQYRAWPLIGYFAFFFLLFLTANELAGWPALVILATWEWLVPGFHLSFSYEAFSEQIAMMFLLGTFLLFGRFAKSDSWKTVFCGLLFGCAYLTKSLILLSVPAFAILLAEKSIRDPRKGPKQALWFALGAAAPVFSFELYRLITLVSAFGIQGWRANNNELHEFFQSSGSGLSSWSFDPDFISKKLSVWNDAGIRAGGWFLAFLSGVWLFFKRKTEDHHLLLLVLISYSGFAAWFLVLSPSGWTRHAWPGLVLGQLLVAGAAGSLFRQPQASRLVRWLFVPLVVCAFVLPRAVVPEFKLTPNRLLAWQTQRGIRAGIGLPMILFSLSDETDVVRFFDEQVSVNDQIYYLEGFMVAELPPLVNRIFFPVRRFFKIGRRSPPGGRSLLVLGPYQVSHEPWVLRPPEYLSQVQSRFCKGKPLFQSESYLICELAS